MKAHQIDMGPSTADRAPQRPIYGAFDPTGGSLQADIRYFQIDFGSSQTKNRFTIDMESYQVNIGPSQDEKVSIPAKSAVSD